MDIDDMHDDLARFAVDYYSGMVASMIASGANWKDPRPEWPSNDDGED